MSKKPIVVACVCLCLSVLAHRVQAEDRPLVDAARNTLQQYEIAVI